MLRQLAWNRQYDELVQACDIATTPGQQTGLYPLLALGYAHTGRFGEAQHVLKQMDERGMAADLDFESRLDLAGARLGLGQMKAGRRILEGLVAERPEHPLALARYGWCLMVMGEAEAAEKAFTGAAGQDPSRVRIWAHLASLALERGDNEAAMAALEKGDALLREKRGCLPQALAEDHALGLDRIRLLNWVRQKAYATAEVWLGELARGAGEGAYVERAIAYSDALAGEEKHAQAEDAMDQGLALYPGNIRLLTRLSSLARLQGRFEQAVRLVRQAIDNAPENPSLWCELADIFINSFHHSRAREAAEKAVALAAEGKDSPGTGGMMRLARTLLARVESGEDNFDRAEALFQEVLAQAPHYPPALQGLGQQYMQQGRIDEAVAVYERIKQVDPLAAHTALILARKFPEDREILEQMEAAASRPGLEGRERAGLLFPLSAAWEKRGEFDRAFGFVVRANEASGKFIRYDRKAYRNYCARIRARFSRALFRHRRDIGLASALPVYVVGMPRSGTTLVEQILSGHSRIFGAGELGTIPMRVQGLNRWERFVGSGRRFPDCADDLTQEVTRGIARAILMELKGYDPDALHVVDKLPHNFENIGFIKLLFPEARIISVRRDPRDIAISNYFTGYHAKHGAMGFAYDLTDIGTQLADHNLLMHHWNQVFPGEILEVRYEDVVDDLEGSARRMLDYIGVAWEDRVLEFSSLDRPVKTASVWQVRQPVYGTSKNRWKHYQRHLAPLIAGTNAKIRPDPVDDMISLPEPGFLQKGVALFRAGDLDGAELSFKKMLHHNPGHAACTYMVGLVYCRKGHVEDGAEMMEKAFKKAPWHGEWRQNLIRAYSALGRGDKAAELEDKTDGTPERQPLPGKVERPLLSPFGTFTDGFTPSVSLYLNRSETHHDRIF